MAYEIAANERIYEVVDDVTTFVRAFAVGRAVDETTGMPVPSLLRARTATPTPGAIARATSGGRFGVVGSPEVAMPDPAAGYVFDLVVEADGFERAEVAAAVPAGSALPVALPDVVLRRSPVRMQGRVARITDGTAVAGALVRLLDPVPPAAAGSVVGLRTPLSFAHPAGTPVRAATITPGATATQTGEPASAGRRSLVLADRTGVVAGSVLRIGAERAWDFVEVAGPGAGAPGPGRVWLREPLRRSVGAGAPVRLVTIATNPPPDALLARPASAGDALLVLDAPVAAGEVQVESTGTAAVEIHATGAMTDAAGYWALGGIGGVRELRIEVLIGGMTAAPTPAPLVIDYGRKVNVVDLRVA